LAVPSRVKVIPAEKPITTITTLNTGQKIPFKRKSTFSNPASNFQKPPRSEPLVHKWGGRI